MKGTVWSVFTLIVMMLLSCTSYKTVPYIQNSDELSPVDQIPGLFDARIQPKDLLTIHVMTPLQPDASAPYNLSVPTTYSELSRSSVSQPMVQPYLVDNDGNINFPKLGILHVGGLTKNEVEKMLVDKLKENFTEMPIVNVRFVNYKISVIGEVAAPGSFNISNEKVNLFEALALAKDLTIYGRRDNVKLIREDSEGIKQVHTLNLNDVNVVKSPYYYLQQNDVVYVTPNASKAKNSDVGTSTTLWFSATSILISLTSLLYNILN